MMGVIALVLVALKCDGAIDWPWMVVFAPIWASVLFQLIALGIEVAGYEYEKRRWRNDERRK